MIRRIFPILIGLGLAAHALAEGSAAEPSATPVPTSPVKKLDDGRVQIGAVTIDPDARTATFPAKVNMNSGTVEYLLVNERGKTHESVLATSAEPVDIHAAMLLLGVKGSPESRGESAAAQGPPGTLNAESLETARLPAGTPVTIAVKWRDGGEAKTAPAEDWVLNEKRGARAARGPWIYNGSEIYAGNFVAQSDGSVVALVADAFALINNPREGYNDDLIWAADTESVPPVGTPVEVTLATVKNPESSRK